MPGGGAFYVFIFSFETWIVGSFAYFFCFLFYSFFDEIRVDKQTSGRSKSASTFLTDCWATLTGIENSMHWLFVTTAPSPGGGG